MRRVKRPWGDFKQFVLNEKCTVKILIVKPGQILSLQKHKKRKEQWYFLTDGWVQLGMKKKKIKKGEIKAIKIGRNYGIDKRYLPELRGRVLNSREKKTIEQAVQKTIREYGETLRLLGKE